MGNCQAGAVWRAAEPMSRGASEPSPEPSLPQTSSSACLVCGITLILRQQRYCTRANNALLTAPSATRTPGRNAASSRIATTPATRPTHQLRAPQLPDPLPRRQRCTDCKYLRARKPGAEIFLAVVRARVSAARWSAPCDVRRQPGHFDGVCPGRVRWRRHTPTSRERPLEHATRSSCGGRPVCDGASPGVAL
jgi:hypothetical protein